MDDWPRLILCAVAGAGIGLLFFGGLWLTLQRLPQSKSPMLWVAPSFLLRVGLSVLGFYLMGRGGEWTSICAGMVGFIGVRTVLVRRIRIGERATAQSPRKEEGDG